MASQDVPERADKYDDTKVSGSQLPLVKQLNPFVRRIITHKHSEMEEL